jgi:type IV secretory pathway TraG/TraD family ATPase VirD4
MLATIGRILRGEWRKPEELPSILRNRQPTPARAEIGQPAQPAQTWALETPLYEFQTVANDRRASWTWTIGDSFQGTVVFGRTGSGKTTGTAEHISRAMLAAGYGGLVLCAKPGEAADWQARAAETGRTDDLVFFRPDQPWEFNFLDYELTSGSKNIEGVVGLLSAMSEVLQPDDGRQDVWERASKELIRNALDLLRLSGEKITASNILAAAINDDFVKAKLEQAHSLPSSDDEQEDLRSIEAYYQREIFPMSEKTRTSLTMSISATLGNFKRGEMRQLFCRGTNLTPLDARRGKIIIVDIPVKKYNDLGILAAAVWKSSFQRAMERVKTTNETRPVFLFADEAQFFVAAKTDGDFQTTARSSRTATVYLTQNFPTLKAKFGGDIKGENKAKGLLGNLVTKIFHANDDPETNQYAAETIGKILQERESKNNSASFGGGGVQGSGGKQTNIVVDYRIQPALFQELLTGGTANNHIVTAVLFSGGKIMPNGRPYCYVAYQAIYG